MKLNSRCTQKEFLENLVYDSSGSIADADTQSAKWGLQHNGVIVMAFRTKKEALSVWRDSFREGK